MDVDVTAAARTTIHRFPLSKSVDLVRWLPPVSAFDRLLLAATHDPSTSTSTIDLHSLTPTSTLNLVSTWTSPSKISSLSTSRSPHTPLLPFALSTFTGSVHFLLLNPIEGVVETELAVRGGGGFHDGTVTGVDLQTEGLQCVSVGEDGRVNVLAVEDGRLGWWNVGDSKGLMSYTAAKWGSPTEFATGGFGFGVQMWDQRKPGGMVSQLKGNWGKGASTGIVHSIDIHPSRKHICVVGGSSGTVFAWDLRWQQQPIMLSRVGLSEVHPPCESEVWEVKCDNYVKSGFKSASSASIIPVMVCSEDGILAVLRQGEEPIELLAENCAINSFDIEPQNPSDVVCALEWESIAILMRA